MTQNTSPDPIAESFEVVKSRLASRYTDSPAYAPTDERTIPGTHTVQSPVAPDDDEDADDAEVADKIRASREDVTKAADPIADAYARLKSALAGQPRRIPGGHR